MPATQQDLQACKKLEIQPNRLYSRDYAARKLCVAEHTVKHYRHAGILLYETDGFTAKHYGWQIGRARCLLDGGK